MAKATRPNTWRDTIDCAEVLIEPDWTRKARIAMRGARTVGEVRAFSTLRLELTSHDAGHFALSRASGNAKAADIYGFVLAHSAKG